MKKEFGRRLVLASAVVVWALAIPAQSAKALLIDSFDFSTFPGALFTAPGGVSFSEPVAGVIAGDRNLDVTAVTASGFANSIGAEISGGNLVYASGPNADGSLLLLYDGPTLASEVPAAMQSISLNFNLFDAGFGSDMDVTITVSDGVNMADLTQSMSTAIMSPFAWQFDLASFNNIGAVDTANPVQISIFFDPDVAQDFELDSVTFAVVPEPSTLLLLALGMFGWLGLVVTRRSA